MREKIEWVGGPAWGALTSLSGLPEEGRGGEGKRERQGGQRPTGWEAGPVSGDSSRKGYPPILYCENTGFISSA